MERHSRTMAKAVSWRVGGTLLTVLIAWVVTRRADFAAMMGVADTVVKIFAFYLHERLWLKIKFGRVAEGEPRPAARTQAQAGRGFDRSAVEPAEVTSGSTW
jgi:uncharacterized membrane protein